MARILTLALLGAMAEASFFNPPQATATPALALDGFSPMETPAPDLRRAKARRAETSTTVFLAPDNTCGYVDGKQDVVFSCTDNFAQCAITSTTGTGYVGCCDAGSCGGYHSTCIGMTEYATRSCGDSCDDDDQVLLCTATGGAYCNTITINAAAFNVWAYYCADGTASAIQNVETTYSGETDGRSFTRTVVYMTVAATATATDGSSDTAGAPTSRGTGTATDKSISGTSSKPTATADDGHDDGHDGSTSHTGAIAGGVVGGVAGIALVAGLVLLLVKRHHKKAAASEAAAAAAAAGGGGGGDGGAAGAAGGAGAGGGGPGGPMAPSPMTQAGGYAAVPQQPPYYAGQPSPAPSDGYAYYGAAGAGAVMVEAPADDVTAAAAAERAASTSPLQPGAATPGTHDYGRMSTVSAVSSSSSPYAGGASPGPVPPTIYEAAGTPAPVHHGTMHELA